MAKPPTPADLDEYSQSSTVISFDRPIPLLRRPIPAALPDNPSSGPFLLAFEDPQSWASAYKACEFRITQQCEAGARFGCSITASNKCKPPWWKTLVGLSKSDFTEREDCEEREMEACVEASKANCLKFAKDKCFPSFRDARIAFNVRFVNEKNVGKLISLASMVDKKSKGFEFLRLQFGTNYRGVEFLGDNKNYEVCEMKRD